MLGLFLFIALLFLIFIPWQNSWRADCMECIDKEKIRNALAVIFGIIVHLFLILATILFVLGKLSNRHITSFLSVNGKFGIREYFLLNGMMLGIAAFVFGVAMAVVYSS